MAENNKLTYAQAGINIHDTDAVKREMAKSYLYDLPIKSMNKGAKNSRLS